MSWTLAPTGPVIIGHSWATRLKNCDLLPNFSFIDLPGGNLSKLTKIIGRIPTHQTNDYVFLLLGGNDIDDCWNHYEVKEFQDSYEEFIVLLRAVFPYAKIVCGQVEVRFITEGVQVTEDIDFRRKGAKFNKWLNKLENKEGLIPIRGANFFSLPFWYEPDGVHLNHAGNVKLATIIRNQYDNRTAG